MIGVFISSTTYIEHGMVSRPKVHFHFGRLQVSEFNQLWILSVTTQLPYPFSTGITSRQGDQRHGSSPLSKQPKRLESVSSKTSTALPGGFILAGMLLRSNPPRARTGAEQSRAHFCMTCHVAS